MNCPLFHSLGKVALTALLATAAAAPPAGARPAAPRAPAQAGAPQCGLGQIAFVRTQGGNSEIFVMNSDGSGQTGLTSSPQSFDSAPSFSPDGSRVAFHSDRDNHVSGRPDVYVMNADGGEVVRLTNAAAADEGPAWSPDAKKIAFISARDAATSQFRRELYVMNADGSGQTRLTFGHSLQPRLSWSPDGSRIVFASPHAPPDPATNRLWVINAAGGAPTPITTPGVLDDNFPAWSPDGRHIAFVRGTAAFNSSAVWLVNPDGGNPRQLTGPPGEYSHLAYSTDGSALAFMRNLSNGGDREIFLMYPDGSGQVNLTNNNAGYDDNPSWRAPQTTAPCLLTEPGTERAAALTSVTHQRDPFRVTNPHHLSPDQRTRVMLFFRNLRLAPGDQTAILAQAEDAEGRLYNLVVEFVGKVPDFDWLAQVVVRLPPELAGAGDVRVSVRLSGGESNRALVNVAPAAP